MSKSKKILVNGKQEEPIKKTKLPLEVDWEKIVREKQDSSKIGK